MLIRSNFIRCHIVQFFPRNNTILSTGQDIWDVTLTGLYFAECYGSEVWVSGSQVMRVHLHLIQYSDIIQFRNLELLSASPMVVLSAFHNGSQIKV